MAQNNLAKNTLIYALGDIIPKFLNIVTFPILTSYLTTSDYGIINYVYSIELFLTIITFLCLKTYYLVHYFKVSDEGARKKLLGNLTIIVVVINILTTTALLIFGKIAFASIGSGIDFFPYIAYGVLINFFGIFSQLPSALYRVQERPLPLTIINVIRGCLIMICTCIFVTSHPDAETVLLIKLGVTAFFAIYFFYITYKNAIFKFDRIQLKQAFAFSLPLVPGDIAYYFTSMSDRILIEKYLTISDLGVYSTAATLAGLLNIISYGAYKAFEPYFFKTYGELNFKREFEKIRNYLLFIVILGGVGLSLYSYEFLLIFSSKGYHEAYLYVPVLVLSIVLNVLVYMYSTVLTAQSKTKVYGAIILIGAFISVGVNTCFLPVLGIWSAPLAGFLVVIVEYIALRYYSEMKIAFRKPVVAIILSIIFVYFVGYVFNFHDNIVSDILIKTTFYFFLVLVLMYIFEIRISDIKILKR